MCTSELGSSGCGPPLPVSTPPTAFDNVRAAGWDPADVDPPYRFYPPYQNVDNYSTVVVGLTSLTKC